MNGPASDETPALLWPIADPAMQVEAPLLRQVYDHWCEIRGHRPMPAREDLRLSAISRALPLLQLYEPVPGVADFRIRLIGTAMTAAFGRDETGKRLSESAFPLQSDRVLRTLLWMRTSKAPFRSATPIRLKQEGTQSIETVWLPFSQNAQDLSLVLACTHIKDEGEP